MKKARLLICSIFMVAVLTMSLPALADGCPNHDKRYPLLSKTNTLYTRQSDSTHIKTVEKIYLRD